MILEMNYRHLILASILISLSTFTLSAQRFSKVRVVKDTVYIAAPCAICDSIESEQRRMAEVDSIFHSLQPDSLTADFFGKYPPLVNMPKVYLGYRSIAPISSRIHLPQLSMNNNIPAASSTPAWLLTAIRADRILGDIHYNYMISNPDQIYCAYSDLPQPIVLPEEDTSFLGYLNNLNFNLSSAEMKARELQIEHINWLHYFNVGLQFSQAYVSNNWYQGGNNYLALLFNFTWNVDLNTVFHPNLLFQSALSYKLGINSNPKEAVHKYSISQDNFQYNLKAGFKAFNHWFYSATLQFKTPLFNTYPQDSFVRSGALLSPGSLNLGLGMTYTRENEKKTFKFSASIAPLSYNLKTCLADDIDHLQYNIKAARKTASEFGSNAEANMMWTISPTVSWTSRMFLFTDYSYFLADWENTLNFQFSRFFSTQLYIHPRYDSSSDFKASKWHYWMLKEILSIGLSYTFSTK